MHQILWSDEIQFLRYGAWQIQLLFLILGYFFPFYPPNRSKNYNFEKMKKTPGEVIVLHTCKKNYDKMMYGSWDMVCNRCNCISFRAIFYPVIPLTAEKIIILRKRRKPLEISSFYIRVTKIITLWWYRYVKWRYIQVFLFDFILILIFQAVRGIKV